MKQKAFFIVFKELSLKKIKQMFLEVESPTLTALNASCGPRPLPEILGITKYD